MQEKQRLWGFFAHAGIITGLMIVVLFVIDRYNPAMEFLTSELSKWLILLLALTADGNGLYSAVLLFQRQKRQEERRLALRVQVPHAQAFPARQQAFATQQRSNSGYQPPREPLMPAPATYARGYDRSAQPNFRAEQAPPRQSTARR